MNPFETEREGLSNVRINNEALTEVSAELERPVIDYEKIIDEVRRECNEIISKNRVKEENLKKKEKIQEKEVKMKQESQELLLEEVARHRKMLDNKAQEFKREWEERRYSEYKERNRKEALRLDAQREVEKQFNNCPNKLDSTASSCTILL